MQSSKILSAQNENPNFDSTIRFPYDISFVDCDTSDAVRFQVEQHLAKLNRLSERITDCKVTVRIPHRHSINRFFHINIALDMPGKRIVVTREPELDATHTGIRTAISNAFHKLFRQTEAFIKGRKAYV